MARFRHPFTVGLPFDQWPGADRAAWEAANRDGEILTGRGPAAHWRPKTRLTARKAYGNWLRFLADRHQLDHVEAVGERQTEARLRDYISTLRCRTSLNTVLTQLRYLGRAIAVMDPDADRSLINLALSRLTPSARPVRNKIARLQTPIVLLELGQKLMTGWQIRQARDLRLNAMDYRDGFMIAFLALCPIRLENLAAITIGEHLTFASGAPRVRFEANEMKSKRALEFDFPADLAQALDFYLKVVHPMLQKGGQLGAPLWPSLHRIQMTEHGIYTRIVQVTQAHLGHPVTPHMFRDAAATFITELTPECAMTAAAVLQHADLETTMKYYVHGQQHLAARKYHDAIDEMIARVEAEPLDAFQE